jgi:double-stranded uracil-DNA glycosylase
VQQRLRCRAHGVKRDRARHPASLAPAWHGCLVLSFPLDASLPEALRAVHVATAVGAVVSMAVAGTDRARLDDVVEGAGFALHDARRHGDGWRLRLERLRTLPDTIGPGMRLLVVGLNPSVVAADAGYGFAGPSNRFWKAAVGAAVVTTPRDPVAALVHDRVGMTDLVKRATPRSAIVTADEYRAGAERVERVVAWLAPAAVCFVGLEGWRATRDRRAVAGWQDGGFGGRPAYVMPSTSGVNASVKLDDLVRHLRVASERA